MAFAMCMTLFSGAGIKSYAAKSAKVSEGKELTFETKVNGYDILIEAKKGVFKKGTTVTVEGVKDSKEADIKKAVLEKGGLIQPLKQTVSFDLVFKSGKKRVNPDGKASVSIKVKEGLVGKSSTVKVYKVDSNYNLKAVDSSFKGGKVSFAAEKSAIYTIAVAEPIQSLGAWGFRGDADPAILTYIRTSNEITIDKDFVDKFISVTGESTRSAFDALRFVLSDEAAATLIKVNATDFPELKDPGSAKEPDRAARLMIYSNKTLDLGGATLVRKKDENIITTGNPDANGGGYLYRNITIKNGTISGGSDDAGLCKFARTDGLVLDNIKFVSFGQHAAEFAAVKNVTMTNCTFSSPNYNPSSKKSGYEALSFDMTSNDKDFSKYAPADYLTCENFVIDHCTFEGVYRAIGSHHYKDGKYYEGIKVTNCTFNNIADTALEGCGWRNGLIQGNTFNQVGYGVDFQQPAELIKGGKYTSYTANNIVDGNTFVMAKTGAKKTHVAIRAGGFTFTKEVKEKYQKKVKDLKNLKIAQYDVNGFTISNNTISGPNTDGISMEYTKNSTVSGNKIYGTEGNSIQFVLSQKCKASDNTTENSLENGIYVKASKNITVERCTITKTNNKKVSKKASSNGVHINNKSSNITVKDCTISGGQWEYGVAIIDKSNKITVKNNTIENTKKNGIKITDKKSTAKAIDKNKIKGTKEHGIYVSNYATVNSLKGNTISSVKKGSYGIYISNHSTVKKFTDNTFENIKKSAQTFISKDCKVKKK
jgi:parallel beta-helix repeat protein